MSVFLLDRYCTYSTKFFNRHVFQKVVEAVAAAEDIDSENNVGRLVRI